MRYLGLDLGSKTLGMALSDKSGLIASSYKVVRHEENYERLIDEIKKVIEEEKVEKIVLGLPKNMNGTIGPKGELSYKFKEMIEENLKIEVELEDERMTTMVANSVLLKGDVSRKKRKEVVDSVAASVILQSYLDRNRRN